MADIVVGMEVRIKSGSPTMTVEEISIEDNEAKCCWYENEVKTAWISLNVLEEYKIPTF
jgi:uncharacterized protein YodC (DUF2158 family)